MVDTISTSPVPTLPTQRNEQRYDRSYLPQEKNRRTGFPAKNVIHRAHQVGLTQTEVRNIHYGWRDDFIKDGGEVVSGWYAVCHARVSFDDGTSFEDFGDADPTNCNDSTANAIMRMASTRAITRALIQAQGMDSNAEEEFGGGVQQSNNGGQRTSYRNQTGGNTQRSGSVPNWQDE